MAKAVRRIHIRIITELTLFNVAVKGLERLYDEWEPSCVVSTSDFWPFEHAVFAEARRVGVLSFVIQHGITNHFWWPFVADKLLLWGQPFYDEIRGLGAPQSRLAICGMPATDQLFLTYQANTSVAQSSPAKSYLILSETQNCVTYKKLYSDYKTLLKASIAATPSIRWLVKLHPVEDQSFYTDMLDGSFPNLSILPKETTLEEAIKLADVACTIWSTAGLEAMVMRRPLVVFDIVPLVRQYAWWPKFGGGTYISSEDAMMHFIGQASTDQRFLGCLVKGQDDFLTRSFANSGRAAEAVLECISNYLSKRDFAR
ncbi:MAG: hypothetical protein ACLQBD_21790 [Syntrophobacteraceae bacterium]